MDFRDIRFEATGGTAPLTWGQRNIWVGLTAMGSEGHRFNLRGVLEVPPGRSLETVTGAIREVAQRHPGLRMRVARQPGLRTGVAGHPYQHVARCGVIRLSMHEAAAGAAAGTASGLAQRLVGENFDLTDEWPVRFALVHCAGTPRQLVVVLSHLVVDGSGLRVLLDDLGTLLAGRALAADTTAWSPLDIAAYEQGVDGRAKQAASLRHWRTAAWEVPATIFDFPEQTPETNRLWGLRMSSSAVAVAATLIAKAGRCSTSAVLLAAVSAVLGHYTGHRRFCGELIAGNRWRPEVVRAVTPMNNNGLFSIAIDDDVPFAEFARVAWRRSLQAYQGAAYDPHVLTENLLAVRLDRGVPLFKDVLINDTRSMDGWLDLPEVTTPGALSELRAATTVEQSGEWATGLKRIYVNVFETSGRATIDFDVDTAFIPVAVGRQMLRGIETLLVRAATRSVSLGEIGELTGIVPAARDETWRWMPRVDGWVRLGEVERVVVAAAGGVPGGVFLVPGDSEATDEGGADERLVAYLGPGGIDPDPEQVHREVCARLRDRYGLVAPDHYVFCATAPVDGSRSGWLAQPVRASGSGRPPTRHRVRDGG